MLSQPPASIRIAKRENPTSPASAPKAVVRQSASFPGRGALAIFPAIIYLYVMVILPLMGGDGKPRIENILFWPLLAGITLTIAIANFSRLDKGFFLSPPVASLLAYFLFAGASITWAFSPENSFTRYIVQLLAVIIVLVPYSLPIDTSRMPFRLHLCAIVAVAVSAIYVYTTPPSPIGHPGYFTHKQELGMLCGGAVILAAHELLMRGWRRWIGAISLCLTFWVLFESQSKGALALVLVALAVSTAMMIAGKLLRLSPAFLVGGAVVAITILSTVWNDPIQRIAWHLYGDSTLTGRTFIWEWINYIVSQRSWFGWGFHSYWGVPNSPHEQAPGFVKDMVSSHSGYLELRLGTGAIGYWIFIVFVYASLHYLEPIRRKDPVRAWGLLSIAMYVILIDFMESVWLQTTSLWILYLIVVGESVKAARSDDGQTVPARKPAARERRHALPPRRTQSARAGR
jgi:exopolysaccharide production protein ExoQ